MPKPAPQRPLPASTMHVACAACALKPFCLAAAAEADSGEPLPVRRRRLETGETLYSQGEAQAALYAVRAGFLKSSVELRSGGTQVLGFHIMGDALGLDALASSVHRSSATALNGSEVCELPLDEAERLIERRGGVGLRLRELLSEQLARAGERMVVLAAMTAHQRVANHLLDLSARWADRGYSPHEFDLSMSRKEIGSYLGLTFESVSRMLSDFHARGVIEVAGRKVRIIDRAALQAELAPPSAAAPQPTPAPVPLATPA